MHELVRPRHFHEFKLKGLYVTVSFERAVCYYRKDPGDYNSRIDPYGPLAPGFTIVHVKQPFTISQLQAMEPMIETYREAFNARFHRTLKRRRQS